MLENIELFGFSFGILWGFFRIVRNSKTFFDSIRLWIAGFFIVFKLVEDGTKSTFNYVLDPLDLIRLKFMASFQELRNDPASISLSQRGHSQRFNLFHVFNEDLFFFLFFSFFFWLRSARNNLSMTSPQSNLNGFIPIRYYSLSWPWMWQQSTYRLKSKKELHLLFSLRRCSNISKDLQNELQFNWQNWTFLHHFSRIPQLINSSLITFLEIIQKSFKLFWRLNSYFFWRLWASILIKY